MKVIRAMANSIAEDIQMKEDSCSNNADKKLPVLDLKLWVEQVENMETGNKHSRVMYEFYEKEMVSNFITMKRSAHPCKMKMTVLGQEVIRRMRNCSKHLNQRMKKRFLSRYMVKMYMSGYSYAERE